MATQKQKRAVRALVGSSSAAEALRKAGYSAKTATHPNQVTDSAGFRQYLDECGLDDASLAKIHKKHLSRRDMIASRGLDMIYKIKGHYAPEKKEISGGLSLSRLFEAPELDPLEPDDE